MTLTNLSNGRQRKTLATQLDRFDTLLDGLADGLNDAVARAVTDAVTLAVQEAVRAVVAEVLANPAVLAQAQPSPTPVPPPNDNNPTPTLRQRVTSCGEAVFSGCRKAWRKVRTAVKVSCQRYMLAGAALLARTKEKAVQLRERCRPLGRGVCRAGALLVAAVALSVAVLLASCRLSATAATVWDWVVTQAVRAAHWCRRVLPLAWAPTAWASILYQ